MLTPEADSHCCSIFTSALKGKVDYPGNYTDLGFAFFQDTILCHFCFLRSAFREPVCLEKNDWLSGRMA